MYELARPLSRIRSTSCRVALQENRRTEIGFCCVVRVPAYRGLTRQILLAAIAAGVQEDRIDYSVHCSCYGEKYPFGSSEYFASVVQRS